MKEQRHLRPITDTLTAYIGNSCLCSPFPDIPLLLTQAPFQSAETAFDEATALSSDKAAAVSIPGHCASEDRETRPLLESATFIRRVVDVVVEHFILQLEFRHCAFRVPDHQVRVTDAWNERALSRIQAIQLGCICACYLDEFLELKSGFTHGEAKARLNTGTFGS